VLWAGELWVGELWAGELWAGELWVGELWAGELWAGELWIAASTAGAGVTNTLSLMARIPPSASEYKVTLI